MDGIIDTSKTYIFTSRFTGSDLVLAVSNEPGNWSEPILSMANTRDADVNGQWFLTRVNGNQPGVFYRVHAASLGVAQSIDVVNDGGAVTSTRLKMAPSGDSSGQAWRFDRWSDNESDGYRLSNKLTGPDMHLDVAADTLAANLFGGDFSGQHWTLASAAGSTPPQQDGADARVSGGQIPLSTGGIVGLAVAAGLGLALLVLGSLHWLARSRSRRRNDHSPVELSAETFKRKGSVQSFQSGQSYRLHQLQTANTVPNQDAETVSPASIYQGGSIDITRSNTGLSGKTVAVREVQPGFSLVAELPDRRY